MRLPSTRIRSAATAVRALIWRAGARGAPGATMLALALASLPAQVTRQERRIVAHHAELLHGLWASARIGPPESWSQLDDALVSEALGAPFAPLARALAARAGVPCDDGFLTRCVVYVNALPEIVDPQALPQAFEDPEHTTPYRLHVTLHTPSRLAETRPLSFALELRDAAGKVAWVGQLGPATSADLATFATTVAIPVQALPDGPYEVSAAVRIGDQAPRSTDPTARARVMVQRGFAARARKVTDEIAALLARPLMAGDRAALLGAAATVQRVYTGDASDGAPDLAVDLQLVDEVLANVTAERPALYGVHAFVTLAVQLASGTAPHPASKRVCLRLRPPAPSDTLVGAPIVLFLVGSPTWDGAWSRPTDARTMPAGWLTRALLAAGFDAPASWACAVMESEGDLDNPTEAVGKVLEAIGAAVPVDLGRVVLVGEREGAVTMLSAARQKYLPQPPCGVVCVAGGALSPGEIGLLDHTSLLLVPARGHTSDENLRRLVELAHAAGRADRAQVVEPPRAWPWALPCALSRIEAFCRERLR